MPCLAVVDSTVSLCLFLAHSTFLGKKQKQKNKNKNIAKKPSLDLMLKPEASRTRPVSTPGLTAVSITGSVDQSQFLGD